MWDRIRERFGSAGLIVGVIALVLAVAGGAYAAGGGLSAKQKKEVKKIAKSFQGTGAQGAPGSPGANGKDGTNGTNGKDGLPGPAGKSVKVTPATTECGEGGAILEEEGSSSAIPICPGAEGSPWTDGGTLPGPPAGEEEEGAVETGTWAFTQELAPGTTFFVPISFSIPLAGSLNFERVHWQDEANFEDFDGPEGEDVGCKPAAPFPHPPAHSLCVYKGPGTVNNAKFLGITPLGGEPEESTGRGANRTGALLVFEVEAAGIAKGTGSFAVTGF
jgi:hypothetical protein